MDKRQPLTREEALALVRRYKEVISPPRPQIQGGYQPSFCC